MMKPIFVAFVFILFLGFFINKSVKAQDSKEISYSECQEASGGITSEMLNCCSLEIEKQETNIQSSIKLLKDNLPSQSQKEALINAQKQWLIFRELNCKISFDPEGGTASNLALNDCIVQETTRRAKELKDILDNLLTDTSEI